MNINGNSIILIEPHAIVPSINRTRKSAEIPILSCNFNKANLPSALTTDLRYNYYPYPQLSPSRIPLISIKVTFQQAGNPQSAALNIYLARVEQLSPVPVYHVGVIKDSFQRCSRNFRAAIENPPPVYLGRKARERAQLARGTWKNFDIRSGAQGSRGVDSSR